MTPDGAKLTRTLLAVPGLTGSDGERVCQALLKVDGIGRTSSEPGQIEVHYDTGTLTVMDLIRQVRNHGYLAGMM